MHITIRVDASIEMGTGHVMRCLTLAEELKNRGADILFVTRALNGHMAETIANHGFSVELLPEVSDEYRPKDHDVPHATWLKVSQEQDAAETIQALSNRKTDWLIVDHYSLDSRWHNRLRGQTEAIMVIDDLADRSHDCDLLLDQNLGRKASGYGSRVPSNCMMLVGPQYALLRPEFAALREYSIRRRTNDSKIHNVLISMGGSDQHNATGKAIEGLRHASLLADCAITVVMGKNAPWIADVQQQSNTLRWHTDVLVNIDDMAQRMADSDLAIGAAGTTSWERCCLGLPTVVLAFADNQKEIAMELQAASAAIHIDFFNDTFSDQLMGAIHKLEDHTQVLSLIEKSANICDGLGVKRVVEAICEE